MKVSLITETFLPQVNGIVRTLEKIILRLEQDGHEVQIITLGQGEAGYSQSPIVRVPGVKFSLYEELHLVAPQDDLMKKFVDKIDLAQVPLGIMQSLLPMPHPVVEQALNSFKPDIIHLVTPATLGAIGFYYAEKLNLPCISSYHTDLTAYASKYQMPYLETLIDATHKLIYNRTDRVLVPSKSSKRQLKRAGVKNLTVFGRGVDTNLFNPNKKKTRDQVLQKYNLDTNKITIMYAGRLAEEKSIPVVTKAFKKLYEEHNLQFILAGDGPLRASLETELKDTPHAFAGLQKGEAFAEIYGAADIFAFPSKTETFGQVVLEAMASGLPVLGFDSPGVRDLVRHEETGYLAPVDDIESFTEYFKNLITDREKRENYGAAAYLEAQNRSWEHVLDGLLDEYQKLIANKKVVDTPS